MRAAHARPAGPRVPPLAKRASSSGVSPTRAVRDVVAGAVWHGPKHTALAVKENKKATAAGFGVVLASSVGMHVAGVDPVLPLGIGSFGAMLFDASQTVRQLFRADPGKKRRVLLGELIWKPVFFGLTVGVGHSIAPAAQAGAAATVKSSATAGLAGMITASDAPIFAADGLKTRAEARAARKQR